MTDRFCGWYFKCQNDFDTLAVIAAKYGQGAGQRGLLQLVCKKGSFSIPFPGCAAAICSDTPQGRLGQNHFSQYGLRLSVKTNDCTAQGMVRFGPPSLLRYDIMGPLGLLPGLQCRHRIISMRHRVDGEIWLNGECYRFANGLGYLEGDRGKAFPDWYVWTQSFVPGGSVMLAAARVPVACAYFTGTVGVVQLEKREYRLASYLGAQVVKLGQGELVVRQQNLQLSVQFAKKPQIALQAPDSQKSMERVIWESPRCEAHYELRLGNRVLLEFVSHDASAEYEYPD